ncbi:hypothetical protein KC722_00370 [Candidatus Kaiserbacteria bacterium]|nr:hypothetical protein [Candidatus Kaiserbacteria bacterium]MCB9811950.1 hypothetical protein [Candidatus Nomurabacteria bacterium]
MRVAGFLVLFLLSTLVHPLVLLPLAILHALSWRAYELLIIAVCADAYFGVSYTLPYYTITTLVILLAAEWVKPHLSFYSNHS